MNDHTHAAITNVSICTIILLGMYITGSILPLLGLFFLFGVHND